MGALLKTWRLVLEILFPPICLNCRGHITRERQADLLCPNCLDGVTIYSNVFYPDPRFSLFALGSYKNTALRELLHYLKYNGFLGAKIPLEKLIVKWLETNLILASSFLDPRFCLVPIPLHKSRLRKRGFNQAELIAEILSRHLNLPVENLLRRIRDTKSQINMRNAKEREANVKDSIEVKEDEKASLLQYRGVILVDDVYTSGATMQEAVKVLRWAGIKDIAVFVIAKT